MLRGRDDNNLQSDLTISMRQVGKPAKRYVTFQYDGLTGDGVSFSIFEMADLEATCTGAIMAPRPGQPKLLLLSHHHLQDMSALHSSSNVIFKNTI